MHSFLNAITTGLNKHNQKTFCNRTRVEISDWYFDQWIALDHLREELNDRGLQHIQIVRLSKFEDELGGSSTLIKKRIALLLNKWEEKPEKERKM